MKKIIIFIFLVCILLGGYYFIYDDNSIYNKNLLSAVLKKTESLEFTIDHYSIFGTHLSLVGCIDKEVNDNLKLILKNGKKEINLDSNFYNEGGKTCFYTSKINNDGLYLDEFSSGNFILLIKQKKKEKSLYYSVKNNTDYSDIEYYTITNNNSNNRINISFESKNNKNYMLYKIKRSKLPDDVYDITIDPGHGGTDTGTSGELNKKTYHESNITLDVSLKLKKNLENSGFKVKLTRDDDYYLNSYGKKGRAVIPNNAKSKYSLSIHVNSAEGKMNYGGVEVYIPNDVKVDFAKILASNLSDVVGYSKKETDCIEKGIYFTSFTKEDIIKSNNDMLDQKMKPYDIKVGAPYMYMIREVGGINTYAYIDGRNSYYGINSYYNSNQTAEPYLIELGYANYASDLKTLVYNSEKFAKAISDSIVKYLTK